MSGVRRPCPDGLFPQWIDGYPTTLPSPYRGRAVSDSTRQTAVSFVTVAELWLGARSLVGLLPPRCREGFKHGSASGHRACFRSHRPTPGRVPSLELSTYALLGAHPPLACAASLMMSLLPHGRSMLMGRTCRVRGCRSSSPSSPWVAGRSPRRTRPGISPARRRSCSGRSLRHGHPYPAPLSGRGILKKCVNGQAVYPLSEQDGLKAQERRYTAYGKEKH